MGERKSKNVKAELEELEAKKLELDQIAKRLEVERAEKQLEHESLQKTETLKESIDALSAQNDVFCGVILSHADLLSVLKVALETGESIKIKYNIYNNK
ncbi:MAG TPA: hypothetical protein DHV48_01080 [Prolixibacteraceae bacterium]|nr:hypothetical protein [Prolixibacteraceae bacterium]